MLASPHLSRWVASSDVHNLRVIFFPSVPYRKIHPQLEAIVHANRNLTVFEHPLISPPLPSALQRFATIRLRALLLRRLIHKLRPSLIHAVELQHAGYVASKALEGMPDSRLIKLSVVNWGSDIYWFRRFRSHRKKITKLLEQVDIYSSECSRDIDLARQLGYQGLATTPVPNCGGVLVDLPQDLVPLTERKSIVLKGYSSFVGKSHDLLIAWIRLRPKVRDATLEIYSASLLVRLLAGVLRRVDTSLSVRCYAHGQLTEQQMWELLGRARVYVGFSASDGLSTSLLEALSAGAIPLQTDSACIEELIEKGFHVVPLNHKDPSGAVAQLAQIFDNPEAHQILVNNNRHLSEDVHSPPAVASLSDSTLGAIAKRIADEETAELSPGLDD